MSGAEILAAISIAAEVAGDVKVIVEGIESVIGFVKGLQGKNRDSTKELQALITTIKTEIIQFLENQQRAEMFAKIYASNNYWVDEALVQIKSNGLTQESLDGPLQSMLGEMGIGKQSMREVIGYHVYNAATLTLDTAGTLCTVMMATSLLFNFEGATWNIRSVLGEVSSPALSQTVKDGLALLQKLNDDYVAKRASLLTLKPHYELGDETIPPGPPSTWLYREYELVDHSPGDTYMKKLNGLFPRRRVPNSIPAAERSKHVVQILWAETKVGGEALPQTIRDITSMVDVLDLAA